MENTSEATPSLTEDDIRMLASAQSFERGVSYYHSGALFNARRVGNELRGHCHGSSYTPYRASAELGSSGITSAHCTCPYDWGGICKHIVTLLLTWIHTPDVFQSVAPSYERLSEKSEEELILLIQEMLKREPDLERLLDLPLQPDPGSPLDLDAFRRQIDFILLDEFPDPAELAFEIVAIAETADRFAAEANWIATGAIYHLILSKIIPTYDQLYDEDGDISSVVQQCAAGLGHCLTESTPDPSTRQSWFDALLEAEFMNIQMGGIDLAYPAGEVLVEHATEEEWNRIEKRVREKITSMNDRYSRWGRESLVTFLGQRLMRTGRETMVTDLIFELGSAEQQAFELVRLGQLGEAISIAREHFVDLPGLVLQFANALVEAGGILEAVAYITSQLETRSRAHYFSWLAQSAEKQQDPETAMKWRLSLFHESAKLENYMTLRAVAQRLNSWISLRPELIEKLEADQHWDLLIVIALEEGEVTRAIELLPHQRWAHHDLQVAKAAESNHPQAALEIYYREVDRLIEARGRGNYQEAAAILQRVKKLYNQQNSHSKWEQFLTELRQHNARLPALMDELNKAGL
jgi:uncharacterized Zn finger protein